MVTQRMVSSARTMGIVVVIGLAMGAKISAQTTVVRPVETNEVLVNPGMGIETFQRFNGDPINPGIRWSEVGPEAAIAPTAAKPDFPEASVAYLRWFWSQLEPEQGKYRWDIIDTALAAAREHRQRLMIRMMPYDQSHPLPDWYRNSGARRANKDSDQDGKIWSPDAPIPPICEALGRARHSGRRALRRPSLPRTALTSRRSATGARAGARIFRAGRSRRRSSICISRLFTATPLLMNYDALEALRYGTARGAGWRLDCWGDSAAPATKTSPTCTDMYPQQLVRARRRTSGQRSPMSLETCGRSRNSGTSDVPLDYILDQALRWHASTINIKSSAIPEDWKGRIRGVPEDRSATASCCVSSSSIPRAVRRGSMAPVAMWWLNAGVAPVYQSYPLALAIGETVVPLEADVTQWLPGDAVVEHSIAGAARADTGTLSAAWYGVNPVTRKPAIRLAIEGRQDDGWYKAGEIVID